MDRVEDIVGRLRGRNERFQSYGGMSMYYGGGDSILDCDAADLIQSQQALIEEMREALEWAVAEIEGRTRYDKENQFGNCLAKANKALSQKDQIDG